MTEAAENSSRPVLLSAPRRAARHPPTRALSDSLFRATHYAARMTGRFPLLTVAISIVPRDVGKHSQTKRSNPIRPAGSPLRYDRRVMGSCPKTQQAYQSCQHSCPYSICDPARQTACTPSFDRQSPCSTATVPQQSMILPETQPQPLNL